MPDPTKPQRWVVEAPCSLRSVLERMHQPVDAILDGRVFIDRKRSTLPDAVLARGNVVDVFPGSGQDVSEVTVLDRRGSLIAVAKPSGISTIPDQRGTTASLREAVARTLGERDATRVHATSRLDREVSGVVIFAIGRAGRDAMRGAREAGRYLRHYVALSPRAPTPEAGWVDAPIGRGRRPTQRRIGGRDAVEARTHYAMVGSARGLFVVAAEPETGRTHQIRVHLSHVGAPLVGDERYGASKRLVLASGAVVRPGRIALHAAWVQVKLENAPAWRVEAPLPPALRDLWQRAGGTEDVWQRAWGALSGESFSTPAPGRGSLGQGDCS